MTDPAKPNDAMVEAGRQTLIAAAIVDVMMGGDTSWRSRIDESEFLESADWAMAAAYANAALAALEPADSDGDGDAEWLRGLATLMHDVGRFTEHEAHAKRINRIATRLEQHHGQGEWEALVKAAERATPTSREIVREDRDDGTERYIVKGVPCGFPVAKFGDRNDAELFIRAAALAHADAPVGDANHD